MHPVEALASTIDHGVTFSEPSEFISRLPDAAIMTRYVKALIAFPKFVEQTNTARQGTCYEGQRRQADEKGTSSGTIVYMMHVYHLTIQLQVYIERNDEKVVFGKLKSWCLH